MRERIREELSSNFPEEELINYPVKVTYKIFGKTKRSFDVDNKIKFLQDCLTTSVLLDDKYIHKLVAIKVEGYGSDKVQIKVEEYNGDMEDL